MAARVRSVKGAKGGTVAVTAGSARTASSPVQARLIHKRMRGRRG